MEKYIDLLFEVDGGEEVLVELEYYPNKQMLIDEAIGVLQDYKFTDIEFQCFVDPEEAELMGLDTY